jgi:hypothetical protein
MKRISLALALGMLCGTTRVPAASTVIISEFLAANSGGLADEDGAFEDWIELHNAGTNGVNLLDWALTDDPLALTKWRFPATTLEAGAYLVVFASGKSRRTPGAPLHTNFRMSSGGEYLALIAPDGATIASEFNPFFPPQVGNVSYGVDSGFRLIVFLPANRAGRVLVPVNGADGTNWILPGFNDSNWLSATGSVGFAAGSVADLQLTNSLAGYWAFDETNGAVAADSSGLGNTGGLRNFPTNHTQWQAGRLGGALRFRGAPFNDYVVVTNYPKSTNLLTVAAWVWADSRPVWATIAKNWPGGNASHFHFGLQDTAGDLSNFIRQNNADYGLREGLPLPLGSWQHVAFVLDATTEQLYRNGLEVARAAYSGSLPLPTSQPLALGAKVFNNGASVDSFWHGKLDEVAIWNRALSPSEIAALAARGELAGQVKTDVKSAMFRNSTTCYLRFPFVVEDPGLYRRWILRIQYNDGFVVWLNGQEVARRNAPDVLAWNSSATNEAPASAVETGETLHLAEFESLIVAGTNLLVIQALNVRADDPDFFIAPSLDALSTVTVTNAFAYFTQPTPGSDNIPGVAVLGPILGEPVHAPAIPLDVEDLVVTVRVAPAFAEVTNVTLRYRVMYSNEVVLAMFDDGAHGDGALGDGLFGATIPANASTNGQMIRYAITAADALGRTSRAPLFNDPLNSDEYFGTVVANPAITTPLPVFHWFLALPSAAETDTGTRCSLFHDGEFYDNIFIRIRGGTARGWPKKSYKVELNEDHEFLLRPGLERVTEFDLNATYTDKSYVRAVLTYEHQRDAGLPSPETFHVHLRQNTAFYSVAHYVDTVDKDFAARWGMDPNGALYKGGPGSTMDTVASYEKKTRRAEGNQDLQAFLAGLNNAGTALENFVFDHVDVPEVVNYMATMAVTQDIDGTDKNHYLHRDTLGSGEWRLLPWDIDLTFGPDALNTDTMVFQLQNTNGPACASHPFIGARPYLLHAGKYQRLIEAMVNTPRTRAMILRRTRTLTEQFLGTTYFQDRIEQLYTLLNADVAADRAKWGASAHFPGTSYTFRAALDRIKNEYLAPRPGYLLGTNIVGVGQANPPRQPFNAVVQIAGVEANPASGNQAQEYVCVSNSVPFSIDLTGWRLASAVDFTFAPGTALPSNGVMYVSPDVAAFRARPAGPRGGKGLFVQGSYSGHLSARGETVQLLDPFGRIVHELPYAGSPSDAQRYLRITELMYHPSPLAGNTNDAEEFEFIELQNVSTNVAVSLASVRFVNGIEFDFTGSAVTSLAPGARVLVVKNLAAFTARSGPTLDVAGQFAGALENGGERIQLVDARNEEILDFAYDNGWYPVTDGLGFSLVVVDELAEPDAWGTRLNWRASGSGGGSPGSADPAPPIIAPAVITEVLTRTDTPPPTDSIELHNPSAASADISGWFLSDDFNTPKKFRIPDGTTLAAGAYRIFNETDFNPGGAGFALGSDGDEVWLFAADAAGNLTGYFHGFRFGAADNNVSFGRHVTSDGREHFVAQSSSTLGSANAGPRVEPVVLSEMMYHPPETGTDDNTLDEFIEISNTGGSPVALFDPTAPTNTWRVTGGVAFTFPPGVSLAAGESILLVNFAPTNAAALAAFRNKFSAAAVRFFGPFGGKLNNDADAVELEKPVLIDGTNRAFVLIERVDYRDKAPWPGGADGFGLSLQRRSATVFANEPANWTAAPATAGGDMPAGGVAPVIVTPPVSQTLVAYQTAIFSVAASGSGPLSYQWRHNGANIPGATNSILQFLNVQPWQRGEYQVAVFNGFDSTVSSNATLALLLPPTIQVQPQGVALRGSTNAADYGSTTNRSATFTVAAYSPAPVTFQWRFNGVPIPSATGPSLTVSNITLAADGNYDVLVTDSVGSVASFPARLIVLLTPLILVPPTDQFAVQGGGFTASVVIKGNPPPFGYVWRQGSTMVTTIAQNATSSFFTRTNLQASQAGLYRVIITNLAWPSVTIASAFNVAVLADADADGIPDAWEQSYFGDATAAARDADTDGDGSLNGQEYLAGTDPTNALSYLKVEFSVDGATANLVLHAVSNRTYTVQFADRVQGELWARLEDVAASSTNRVETVVDRRSSTNRFYRLITPRAP